MKKLIMTTGTKKAETGENVRKRVTFENQDGSTRSEHENDVLENGVYMQVRGQGLLMIRSSSLNENEESVVDIFLNVRSPSSPVTLILPKERNGVPDVFGDGDIQFTMKGADEMFNVNAFGDSEKDENSKNEGNNEHKDKVKYTHRRSNSDYLQVWGKGEYCVPDNADERVEDNEKINVRSGCNELENERFAVENSFSFPTLHGQLTSLYSHINDTVDSNMAKLNKLSEESRQWSCENNNSTHEQEPLDIGPESEKELNNADEDPFPKRYDSLPIYRRKRNRQLNFRRSVKASNKNIWQDGTSLKSAIQHSYTYLLDVLEVLELCDHLYENCLLDINMYQKMFELCFEHHQVLYAKRYLLMYLSTRSICQDKFVDALYGSAQYQLIPLFYPGVQI